MTGASAAAVQDLIGHERDAISANYTHIVKELRGPRSALCRIFLPRVRDDWEGRS